MVLAIMDSVHVVQFLTNGGKAGGYIGTYQYLLLLRSRMMLHSLEDGVVENIEAEVWRSNSATLNTIV